MEAARSRRMGWEGDQVLIDLTVKELRVLVTFGVPMADTLRDVGHTTAIVYPAEGLMPMDSALLKFEMALLEMEESVR